MKLSVSCEEGLVWNGQHMVNLKISSRMKKQRLKLVRLRVVQKSLNEWIIETEQRLGMQRDRKWN